MLSAKAGKEAVIRVGSELGVLSQVTKAISEKGISLLAICAWEEGDEGIIRVVTDDHRRTMDVLIEQNLEPLEGEVVIMTVPHRTGMIRHLSADLTEYGISIKCMYGTAPVNEDACMIVLATSDTDRTIVALNR
ncbi:hypothetical protein BVX99_02360 [bacterium F16]|nr:hypothetical protein BVX99_02360 [bacterium F16]